MLHQRLAIENYDIKLPHPVRFSYWGLVPRGFYNSEDGRDLILQYMKIVEEKIGTTISKHSLPYWLHVYRRLSPRGAGSDNNPRTVGLTRMILEAAFQKYAKIDDTPDMGLTNEVRREDILDGALMSSDFDDLYKLILERPQLVLRKFNLDDLKLFYETEKLGYEIWLGSANLRSLSKGAQLFVDDNPIDFYDKRSDELNKLIKSYDNRIQYNTESVSAKSVVFTEAINKNTMGILLPSYNLYVEDFTEINHLTEKVYNFVLPSIFVTNFLWTPFKMINYLESHKPYSTSFEHKHGVNFFSVIIVLTALLYRVMYSWSEHGASPFVHHWQRAYDGPTSKENIESEIKYFLPIVSELFQIPSNIDEINFENVFNYLKLSENRESEIALNFPGPHSIFLPVQADRYFIDYAWIEQRLYYLFLGVNIEDETFKGRYLEHLINKGSSILPMEQCKSINGTFKQIDAAFEVMDILIIIECKAISKSIAYESGDPRALKFRIDKTTKALEEVDNKAKWLINHPKGINYDICKYSRILPLVVTPFTEYIPSIDSHYWISDVTPRILTPLELNMLLNQKNIFEILTNCPNLVNIF